MVKNHNRCLRVWQVLQERGGVGNSATVARLQRSCGLTVIRVEWSAEIILP